MKRYRIRFGSIAWWARQTAEAIALLFIFLVIYFSVAIIK